MFMFHLIPSTVLENTRVSDRVLRVAELGPPVIEGKVRGRQLSADQIRL